MEVLLTWICEGDNYDRWLGLPDAGPGTPPSASGASTAPNHRFTKEALCFEIIARLASAGIVHRRNVDIRSKIYELHNSYARAKFRYEQALKTGHSQSDAEKGQLGRASFQSPTLHVNRIFKWWSRLHPRWQDVVPADPTPDPYTIRTRGKCRPSKRGSGAVSAVMTPNGRQPASSSGSDSEDEDDDVDDGRDQMRPATFGGSQSTLRDPAVQPVSNKRRRSGTLADSEASSADDPSSSSRLTQTLSSASTVAVAAGVRPPERKRPAARPTPANELNRSPGHTVTDGRAVRQPPPPPSGLRSDASIDGSVAMAAAEGSAPMPQVSSPSESNDDARDAPNLVEPYPDDPSSTADGIHGGGAASAHLWRQSTAVAAQLAAVAAAVGRLEQAQISDATLARLLAWQERQERARGELEARERATAARLAATEAREQALDARERALDARERELEAREHGLGAPASAASAAARGTPAGNTAPETVDADALAGRAEAIWAFAMQLQRTGFTRREAVDVILAGYGTLPPPPPPAPTPLHSGSAAESSTLLQ
ncbi:hypothetical protein HK405_010016 [Cladochytrium tenue]|nr:hypothetical protein HK405_010016 [Cladochytrium tenue]